jgi:tetratricopeptide (TPR) repeat protein
VAQARRLASTVWARDPRLPALLAEWAGGHRGGPVEKQFQDHLRALAWEAFERAVRAKGSRVIPKLYLRRGMVLADRNDLQGARKEFLSELDEASRDRVAADREEAIVESHNALGVIAWTVIDYPQALRWLRLAEAEQKRFGGNWILDLTANRQRLEKLIALRGGRG